MARYAKKANKKVPKYGVGGYIGGGVGALAGTASLLYGIDQARKKNNPHAAAGILGSLIGYGGGIGSAAWQYFQNKAEEEALQAADAVKERESIEQQAALAEQQRQEAEQIEVDKAKAQYVKERDANVAKPLEQKVSDNQRAIANARSNTKSGNAQIYQLPNASIYGGKTRYPLNSVYILPGGHRVTGEQLASWYWDINDPNGSHYSNMPKGLPWQLRMDIQSGNTAALERFKVPDYQPPQPTEQPFADGGYAPRFGYGGYIAGGLAGLGAAGMAGTGAYQGIKKKDYGSLAAGLTGAALSGLAAEELIRGQYNQNVAEEKQDKELRRLFKDAVVENAVLHKPNTLVDEISPDATYQIGGWTGTGKELLHYMNRYHDSSFSRFPGLEKEVRGMYNNHIFTGISPEQIGYLESRNFDRLKVPLQPPIQPPIQEAPSDSSSSLAHGGYAPRYSMGGAITAGVPAALFAVGSLPLGAMAYDDFDKGKKDDGIMKTAAAISSVGAGIGLGIHAVNEYPWYEWDSSGYHNAQDIANGRKLVWPPNQEEENQENPQTPTAPQATPAPQGQPVQPVQQAAPPVTYNFGGRHFTREQMEAIERKVQTFPDGGLRALIRQGFTPEEATQFLLGVRAWANHESSDASQVPSPNATAFTSRVMSEDNSSSDDPGTPPPNPPADGLAHGGYAPRYASGGIHPWAIAAGLPAMGVGGLTDVLALSGALDNYSPRNKKGEVQRWPWVLGGSALGLGGLGSLTYGVGGFEGGGSGGQSGGPSLGERIDAHAQDPSMFSNAIKGIGDFFNQKGYTLPVVPRNLLGLKILNSGKGGRFLNGLIYNTIDTNALSRGGKVPRYVMGGGISEVGGFDPMEEERKKQLLNWQMQMSQQQQMFDQQQMMEDQDVPMEADGGRSPRYLDTVIPGAMGLGSVPRYDVGGALAEVLPAVQGAGATEGALEDAVANMGSSGPLSFWEMLMKKKKGLNLKDLFKINDVIPADNPDIQTKLATAIQEGSTQDAIKDAVAQADPRISEWEAMKGDLKQKGGKLLEKGAEALGQAAGSAFGPLGGVAGKYLVKAGIGGYQLWKKHRDAVYAQQLHNILESFKETGSGLQDRQHAVAAITANAAKNMLATSKAKRAANFRMLAEGGEAPRFEGVSVPGYLFGGKSDEEDEKIIKEASEGIGNNGIDWNKWNPVSGSQGNYYQPHSTISGRNTRGGSFMTDDSGHSHYRMTNNPFDIFNKIRYSRTMRHGLGGTISKAVPFGVGLFHPFTGAAYGTAKSLLGMNGLGLAMSGIPLAGMLGSMYSGAGNPMKFGWKDLKDNFTNNMNSWALPGIWRKRTGNMFYDAMNVARAATIAAPLLI